MNNINDLRLKIDKIDEDLLDLIIERLKLVREIGEEKRKNNIGIIDKNREQEILDRLLERAKKGKVGLNEIKKIWKVLMEISYEIETSSEPHKGSVGEGGKNGNS